MKNLQDKKPKNSINFGDIFTLGNHRLICGDAKDRQIVERLLRNECVNLIVTDPPYGVAYVENKKGFLPNMRHQAIANDHLQSEDDYESFTEAWLQTIKPYLHKKNSFYIFNSDRMIFSIRNALQENGFRFSQLLVWIKNQAVIGRLDYLPQHELIAYGWMGTHNFRRSKAKSILFAPKPQRSALHPTMKPISLLRELILNSTQVGESVYDPFGGSGSTLLACEQTKRKCFMIELNPDYCSIIIDRFEKLSGIKAQKFNINSYG